MLSATPLESCKVLLVEGNAVQALDLKRSLRQLGCSVLGPAGSRAEAATLLGRERPNLALLDIVLLDGSAIPLARQLVAETVPFAALAGRNHDLLEHPLLYGRPYLPKPCTLPRLRATVRQLYRLDLARSLKLTEWHIAQAWERIAEQVRIITRLAGWGEDTREAEGLLQAREQILVILEARRDHFRQQLERQGGPACLPDRPDLSPEVA